jgi:acyl-CoA thioesterase
MTCLDAPTEFDRTICLTGPDEAGRFAVELPDEWLSLVGMHGGYLTSLAVRGAEAVVPDRDVRTLTTSFLRAAQPGRAVLEVSEVRRGRSVSTVAASLIQGGRPVITTRLTLLSEQTGVEWQRGEPILVPPIEDCVPIDPPAERAVRRTHFERAQGLLDPSSIPFTDGPRAMVRGYVRPLEPRPIDAAWLAMAVDWFPPPAFVSLDPPTGGISVDLTTHVHRTIPDLGADWLVASFEIVTSSGGLATEHGRIATRDGVLIAESMQTRWTADR